MKQRIISAIIIMAILIPVYILGGAVWAGFIGLGSVIAYQEILKLKESHMDYPVVIKVLGLISLVFVVFLNNTYDIHFGISYPALGLTTLMLLIPTLFVKKYNTKEAFYLIGIVLLLGLAFNSLILLEQINSLLLVYLILISTMNDTFAYIVGVLIGKTKFTSISPKKSIEGCIGGLIGGTIVASSFYMALISNENYIVVILTTLILGIISQSGDLIFSKIKRENKVKDFSKLIPGHGGLLDRIDSIIITVLAYIVIISL